MAFVRKRGQKWQVRWQDLNGLERGRTYSLKADALKAKRQIEIDLENGIDWDANRRQERPQLKTLFDDYLEHKSLGLSEGTMLKYSSYLRQCESYLEERFKHWPNVDCSVLSQKLVRDLCAHLLANGRHGHRRQPITVVKIKEVLELAWQWGYESPEYQKWVPVPQRYRELKRPAPERPIAATESELRAVLKAFPEAAWQRRLAIVLIFTGLRVNQAMQLRWTDFDLDQRKLRIRRELGKSAQERRGRVVFISRHLASELARWERSSDYIIDTNRTGARARQARSRDMARAWKRAGVRPEVWSQRPHHAFRKAFCSILRQRGAEADAVEFLVGHDLGIRGVYIDEHTLQRPEAAIDLFPNLLEPA